MSARFVQVLVCVGALATVNAAGGTGKHSDACLSQDQCANGLYCSDSDFTCQECWFCAIMDDALSSTCGDACPNWQTGNTNGNGNFDYGESDGESEGETTAQPTTAKPTTAAPTQAPTTAKPATNAPTDAAAVTTMFATATRQAGAFFCDPANSSHPENTSPDCTCDKSLGCKGGSCKSKGSDPDSRVCAYCRQGYIKVAKKCVTQVACKGGKIETPPKMKGLGCKCETPGAHYCKRTAEKEIVTTCRADKKGTHYYAYDNTCVAACPKELTSSGHFGTIFKKKCLEPFFCKRGYLFDVNADGGIGGKRDLGGKSYGCRCPLADNSGIMKDCHTCDFQAGEFGQRCVKCQKSTYLHQGKCLASCDGTGLAAYLPATHGGTCTEEFTCTDRLSDADGSACTCPNAVRDGCSSCTMKVGGPKCIKCDRASAKPYLHAGKCVSECPASNPAVAPAPQAPAGLLCTP